MFEIQNILMKKYIIFGRNYLSLKPLKFKKKVIADHFL